MEKLHSWIKKQETIKDFLQNIGMSKSFFYEWSKGQKGLSLQKASKIVSYTQGEISFDDLVEFENSFK